MEFELNTLIESENLRMYVCMYEYDVCLSVGPSFAFLVKNYNDLFLCLILSVKLKLFAQFKFFI